jgi:hypothetical protein
MNRKEINIQSDRIEDLLSKIPNWITRWGISLIFLTLFFVMLVTNFIDYPDVIKGKIVIQNNNLNRISCLIQIPQETVYRIKPGMDIMLKLDRYPFQKYGMFKSQIIKITDSTINGYLTCVISLPKQIKTGQIAQLVFNKNMKAECDIIVDNKSIFNRLSSYIINRQD